MSAHSMYVEHYAGEKRVSRCAVCGRVKPRSKVCSLRWEIPAEVDVPDWAVFIGKPTAKQRSL